VLSDDVRRKRYDFWAKSEGPDAGYPDDKDWQDVDAQLGE
jgi:hypothetical protein